MYPLKTDSGKIEIYSVKIAGYGYADCEGYPVWLESDEWFGNAEPDQLQLFFAHPACRLHNQLSCSTLRKQYAVVNREPITIHPQDAHACGIADGGMARVWNQHGQILTGAMVMTGIRPGVICTYEGVRPDLDLTMNGICKNGAISVLAKDPPGSKSGNGYTGNTALAWLKKYSGPMLVLMAFNPPASP